MAAAIARAVAGDGVRIESAGVGAISGADATPEAREAVRRMGIEMGEHASRPLTRQLIEEADEIVCMTPDHVIGVLELDPEARGKTTTLAGEPIPDPIGMPLEHYVRTARTLRALIQRRMQEAQL